MKNDDEHARTQSCFVGGLGDEDTDEVAEMDQKIKQLEAAVTDKDEELRKLKETIKMLQDKVAKNEEHIDNKQIEMQETRDDRLDDTILEESEPEPDPEEEI